jgi:3-deoxy-manno-octulosonate cytidylyltransferase (CMP-KDO synthetase)
MNTQTLVVIPARMASNRLPGKPLVDIGGEPMIVHVWRRALEAKVGDVAVACDDERIARAILDVGGTAVLTRSDHPSGSDRIWEAVKHLDPAGRYQCILNLQGDLPDIAPAIVAQSLAPLSDAAADIATLAVEIRDPRERTDPNVVKVVGSPLADGTLRALYFTRATAPWGDGPLYHHIGIYAYRRPALERFVHLEQSALEKRERLEQLRALENGMDIRVGVVDRLPISVDTVEELDRVRLNMIENAAERG